MGMRLAALGLLCAAVLFAQRGRHFSWQDSCFKNPGLPYCQGRDYAVKNPPPKKDNPRRALPPRSAPTTSVITIGEPDDAQPLNDAFITIVDTPLAQHLATLIDLVRFLSAAPAK